MLQCVQEPWYSSVHRGTGFKSWIATDAYDKAQEVVGKFVGADLTSNVVTFTKNTTESINKLAHRINFQPGYVVVTTSTEHHSNDLPWRRHATVIHVPILEHGYLDINALRAILIEYKDRVKLVAVSGAPNITGICPPIHDIAELVHAAGAKISGMVFYGPTEELEDKVGVIAFTWKESIRGLLGQFSVLKAASVCGMAISAHNPM